MIRSLRKRLIAILMILLSLIMLAILAAINLMNYNFNMRQTRRYLSKHIKTSGVEAFCSKSSTLQLDEAGYCTVLLKENEEPEVLVNQINKFSDRKMISYSKKAAKKPYNRGTTLSLVYLKERLGRNQVVIFMDNNFALENSLHLFTLSIVWAILGLFVLFGISVALSRWLTAPVEETMASQKRFISDASHELKTPLTIISANVDLLEDTTGNNKHLEYIRSESNRMSNLINQMLMLTRVENISSERNVSNFSLDEASLGIILPFESVAYEQGVHLSTSIESPIMFWGNKDELQQLVSILLDNAVHHCNENGKIKVALQRQHKKAILTVSNTGDPIPENERTQLFQRFYQAKESRNSQGNHYGLGLAIAYSITQKHHGKIAVVCEDGWTTFSVTLPIQNH